IVQCKTCQGFNHVKSNCYKTARCVKCAGYHHTKDCTKDRSTEPKCANCGQEYTANYRGCMVAVELQ
ncbi:Nucleic-acid-binding protein from transposon X-element, partial [Camponotus floridanus]